MFDVAVVGLGPAGRALASACRARDLSVLVVDPRPQAIWTPTYGIWADELGALPTSVVRARVTDPQLRARGVHQLNRTYVVLDNAAVQAALPLEGASVRRVRLDDAGVTALRAEARVVVDARGARPAGHRPDDPSPAQTAFGLVLHRDAAAAALQGAESLFMDWRTDWAGPSGPSGTPTFLYAIPLGDDRVLLEETCLAAAPGLPIDELKSRLYRRLRGRGVPEDALAAPIDREVVRIPMRGRGAPPPAGALAFGTAGRGGNLVTGYSVAHSFARAGAVAKDISTALAAGRQPDEIDPPRPADVLREAGLRALLRLDVDGTVELFDAFGRLPAARQRDFLSGDADAPGLAAAMWGMFARLPWSARTELARATLSLDLGL